ncbi:Uncharacterized protein APZ42_006220, partial [Daphnia magna]
SKAEENRNFPYCQRRGSGNGQHTPLLPFPFPLPLVQSPDRAQQPRKLSTSVLDVLSSPNLIATLQGQHHTCSSHEETLLPSGTPASNQATFRIFHSAEGESNGS